MQQTRYASKRYVQSRRQRGRRRRAAGALVALAIAGACAGVVALVLPGHGARGGGPATSTPRGEWRQGSVPALYQTDPAWADEPYAGGTVAERGCGPTCLAMAYVALTGRTDLDPAGMCAFSEAGGFVQDGMTTWALMTDGAAQLGLTSEELPASAGAVTGALAQGRPVICSVRPGDFTTTGHFIVLAGVSEDGGLVVRDPNSAERSAQTWDVERVLAQCANLWALGVG